MKVVVRFVSVGGGRSGLCQIRVLVPHGLYWLTDERMNGWMNGRMTDEYGYMYLRIDKPAYKQQERQTTEQTDGQVDRQINRQSYRFAINTFRHYSKFWSRILDYFEFQKFLTCNAKVMSKDTKVNIEVTLDRHYLSQVVIIKLKPQNRHLLSAYASARLSVSPSAHPSVRWSVGPSVVGPSVRLYSLF
jgi:hypothetical protein